LAVEIGQEAPDFTLRDENNQEVKLSDLRGSTVVLMFYPLDFSPVCTTEHCAMRDNFYKDFQAAGAKVYGISRDSVWTHKAFKQQENIEYPLLADMNGDVAKKYGAWSEQFGLAGRLTVVIDEEGKVKFSDQSPDGRTARDPAKTLAAVRS
jgi:mycoredoxin-dependent peroxiredoxin